MQCPITSPQYHEHTCEMCEGEGRVLEESREGELADYRKCPECEGDGRVSYTTDDHPDGCEVCEGLGMLPPHVEAWVAAEQIAEIHPDVQRAVIALHNMGMLVRPPATCEYGLVELCIARTDDLNELLSRVGIEPRVILNTEIGRSGKSAMGHWVTLDVPSPLHAQLRKFATAESARRAAA